MRVDAQHAAFDLARNPKGALEVVRPEGTAEAVARIVHFAQHLCFVVKRADANDRPKNFLTPDAVIRPRAQQHGRLEVETPSRRALSASRHDAPGLARFLDKFLDSLPLCGGNQRTDLRGFVRGIADSQLP